MAASISSASKTTTAAICSSALISTTTSISMRKASGVGRVPRIGNDLGRGAAPRVAMTVDVTFVDSGISVCMHADFGISTMQVPDVHDSTAIFNGEVVGQHLRHRVPVAGREARQKALDPLGLPRFPAAALAG